MGLENTRAPASATLAGGPVSVSPVTPDGADLSTGQNVIAEAFLDMPGLRITPPQAVSEAVLPDQSLTFRWRIQSADAGDYSGTAWLNLIFVNKSTGEERRRPLYARGVVIKAEDLAGLGGSAARIAGLTGTLFGGAALAALFHPLSRGQTRA